MKVFLIGYMGSGKSTLGSKLAKELKLPFMDLDILIETHTGMSIPAFFAKNGEPNFRQLEAEMLRLNTLQHDAFVMSTGGGTPTFYDNIGWMNQKGISVYLEMSPKALVSRLKDGKSQRPLLSHLTHEELEPFISSQLAQRTLYYKTAHLIINGLSPNVQSIAQQLQSMGYSK